MLTLIFLVVIAAFASVVSLLIKSFAPWFIPVWIGEKLEKVGLQNLRRNIKHAYTFVKNFPESFQKIKINNQIEAIKRLLRIQKTLAGKVEIIESFIAQDFFSDDHRDSVCKFLLEYVSQNLDMSKTGDLRFKIAHAQGNFKPKKDYIPPEMKVV